MLLQKNLSVNFTKIQILSMIFQIQKKLLTAHTKDDEGSKNIATLKIKM